MKETEKIRIQKYISDAGIMSRRAAEKAIEAGEITVNGETATIGMKVDTEKDTVAYKGKKVRLQENHVYLMLNKPQGFLSATEDKHDPVVVDLVPEELKHFKPFPVGRLDKDTEGLLLLTNDGKFDHELMSPRKNLYKRYYAELDLPADKDDIALFAAGMVFKDFTAKPAKLEIDPDNPRRVYVEIAEGKYHQVKLMFAATENKVIYLERLAIGGLTLDPSLNRGECLRMSKEMLEKI